jgi:glyoxylase-like metal-dependent hydrolase (beta-lactamase superfamily II)
MKVDLSKPVEIAEDVFWVGHYIEDDIFQCHPYLIRNGSESVLIDPGSLITFQETLRKIKYLVALEDIKYIVCHHQDPDITACLPELERILPERERYIVTHWRTYFLLKHYNLLTSFYLVDQHNFRLSLQDRELQFILTPYMHYSGNIVTYDKKTKTLFSSDIFGGWVEEGWSLFAESEEYIKSIRRFHEIYMPCKEVVLCTMERLKKLDIKVIAPQHGSIIKDPKLIKKVIVAVEQFDYGKMFEADVLEVFKRKLQKSYIISLLKELAVKEVFLSEILKVTLKQLSSILPIDNIVVLISAEENVYVFSKENGFFPRAVRNFRLNFKESLVFSRNKTRIVFVLKPGSSLGKEDGEFLGEIAELLFSVTCREERLLFLKERERRLNV